MGTELAVATIQLNSIPDVAATRVRMREQGEVLSLNPPFPVVHWLHTDDQKMVTGA